MSGLGLIINPRTHSAVWLLSCPFPVRQLLVSTLFAMTTQRVPIHADLQRVPPTLHDGYAVFDGYLHTRLCIPKTSLRDYLIWELHAGGLAGAVTRR